MSSNSLQIGDTCRVKNGTYAGIIVEIIDLPDEIDKRYSVSRNGFAGLRFERENLEQVETQTGGTNE